MDDANEKVQMKLLEQGMKASPLFGNTTVIREVDGTIEVYEKGKAFLLFRLSAMRGRCAVVRIEGKYSDWLDALKSLISGLKEPIMLINRYSVLVFASGGINEILIVFGKAGLKLVYVNDMLYREEDDYKHEKGAFEITDQFYQVLNRDRTKKVYLILNENTHQVVEVSRTIKRYAVKVSTLTEFKGMIDVLRANREHYEVVVEIAMEISKRLFLNYDPKPGGFWVKDVRYGLKCEEGTIEQIQLKEEGEVQVFLKCYVGQLKKQAIGVIPYSMSKERIRESIRNGIKELQSEIRFQKRLS